MRPRLLISAVIAVTLSLGTVASPSNASAQEPFLGEIIWVGFNFCPRGFAAADGQLLPISQNTALFSLYGTTYGGDGRTTFGLPDLRSRVPVHTGDGPGLTSRALGSKGGEEAHSLTSNEMPAHSHGATASVNASDDPGNNASPDGALPALAECTNYDGDGPTSPVTMSSSMVSVSIGNAGGNQAHNNMQPFLTLNACVAITGLFPSRN